MKEHISCEVSLALSIDDLEPAPPRENHGDVSWVASTPRPPVSASLHLLALQLKPSLSGLSAPEHPLFTRFNPCDGDARDRNLIGRGVLITPSFVGEFSRCSIYYPALACRVEGYRGGEC